MSATTIIPADTKLWRKGFLDLRPSVVPCPGLTAASWSAVHAKGVDFLDRWADEAAALGWTTLDLFGVHPKIGTVRPDVCGVRVMSAEFARGPDRTSPVPARQDGARGAALSR